MLHPPGFQVGSHGQQGGLRARMDSDRLWQAPREYSSGMGNCVG